MISIRTVIPVILCLLNVQLRAQQSSVHLYGSIHSHSNYSDGNQEANPAYPDAASCFGYARDRALQVDFWGISDHNHSGGGMSLPDYTKGVREADSVNADGQFVSLYGMEWGIISTGGHVIVYGIDSLIGWESGNFSIYNAQADYNSLFGKIAARGDGAFAWLAHMDAGDFGDLLTSPYNAVWDSAICGIAIRSGPAFSTDTLYNDPPGGNYADRYRDLLRKGYHLAPGIDHDSHYITFGRSHQGRTVVVTDTLTREAVMRAFRRRSVYASDDFNARVAFAVSGLAMGSSGTGTTAAQISVQVNDPDGEGVSNIKIWKGVPGGSVNATTLATLYNQSAINFSDNIPVGSPVYYFAEITQPDGHRIWTAPVWYTRTNNPGYELLRFDASLIQNQAKLEWSAINETGVIRYGIERSADGIQFTTVDWVNSTGGNGVVNAYTWPDPILVTTATYYRLKIEDVNGLFSFSPIRKVDPYFTTLNVELVPTVVDGGELLVQIRHDREEPLLLEVFDAAGRLMLNKQITGIRGTTDTRFDTTHWAAGHYSVQVSNTDLSFSDKTVFIRR